MGFCWDFIFFPVATGKCSHPRNPSCYVGRHVSDQCYDTPTSAKTFMLRG